MTTDTVRWIPNPLVIYREEFDGAAMLYDQENQKTFALDELGVLIWKCIDGKNSVGDILAQLVTACEGIPESAKTDLTAFLDEMAKEGLIVVEAA